MRRSLVVTGVLFALAGLTFTLQGIGIVGPSSSFMFRNGAWIYEGSAMLGLGLFLTLAGTLMSSS